jgi:hypothetical protein
LFKKLKSHCTTPPFLAEEGRRRRRRRSCSRRSKKKEEQEQARGRRTRARPFFFFFGGGFGFCAESFLPDLKEHHHQYPRRFKEVVLFAIVFLAADLQLGLDSFFLFD